MLKYLKVSNFLSFKDETIIDFTSDLYGNLKNNVIKEKDTTLNKSLIIYWPNASGKTNIINLVSFIKYVALHSHDWWIDFDPFLLDDISRTKESSFEIWYFDDEKEYKYGFSMKKNKFLKEYFYHITPTKDIAIFDRNSKWKIDTDDESLYRKEISKWEWKVKEWVSLMSVLWQWNAQIDGKPINSFFEKISILRNSSINTKKTISLLWLNEWKNKESFVYFLKSADINVDDIKIKERKLEIPPFVNTMYFVKNNIDINKERIVYDIELWHKKENWELEFFPLEIESSWTVKLFYMLWYIIDTILNEKILFVDEIENNLHVHILKNLLTLIHWDNWKKYQFIFTTHCVDLMNLNLFKKSQIWITQKDKFNSTEFYTLADYSELRTENDIKKLYNIWALWWVPYISDLSPLIKSIKLWKETK